MKKLFLIFGIIAIFTVVGAGIGFYWVSASAMKTAKRDAVSVVANGTARAIAKQTQHLTLIVQGITKREDVRDLVRAKDIAGLEKISESYELILPGAKKIRILLPETTQRDTRQVPHLGYADLEMIRETFKANQQPVVQGDKGPNRHLAITRGVVLNEQVAAVLLASIDYAYLKQSLKNSIVDGGRIELKQGDVVLAGTGEVGEDDIKSEPIKVSGTPWVIQSQVPSVSAETTLSLYAAILIAASILIVVISIFGFKWISKIIRSDQNSILKATKTLVEGKALGKTEGRIPTPHLGETQEIITEMSYFIKGIDESSFISGASEITEKAPEKEKELTMDDFFDEFNVDEADTVSKLTSNTVEQADNNPMDPGEFLGDTSSLKHKSVTNVDSLHKSKKISGVFGHKLDVDKIQKVAQAIGTELKDKGFGSVVVARDGYQANPTFYEALQKGLVSTGVDLLDIGVATLPALYFAVQFQESKTGVMLTGTDNSLEHGNVKILIDGELISEENIQKHQLRLDIGDFLNSDIAGVVDVNETLVNDYTDAVKKEIKIARPMKVVIDCGNGAASTLMPVVLKELGCNVTEINCDFDGKHFKYSTNYNDWETLNELSSMVKLVQADIGFAIYGVGDRLAVVDAGGNVILADQQMMLYAKDVLKLIPGAKIIYDIMSSEKLATNIIKNGGKPIMIKANHIHIKQKMNKEDAALAGEMTGNFYFKDRWFGFDDAIYSAARMLEILSHKKASTTDVFADLPARKHNATYTLPMSSGEVVRFIKKLADVAIFPEGKISCIDCLRVDFVDGLGVASPSQLSAAVELRFEADSEAVLLRIRSDFKKFLAESKPGMKIPF